MKIFTGKHFWILLLVLIGIGAVYIFTKDEAQKAYKYKVISATDITEEVSVTGKVKPIDTTNLTFENNGKIQNVYVKVGDHVKAGTQLVRLSNEELWAQKNETIANLKQAQAQLNEAKVGNRPEEIQIQQSRYEAVDNEVLNARQKLKTEVEEAFTIASFIVRQTIANLTSNPSDHRSKILFASRNSIELNNINNQKFYLNQDIDQWESDIRNLSDTNLTFATTQSQKYLKTLRNFINDLAVITPTFWSSNPNTQSTIDQWKLKIEPTQNSINMAIAELDNAEEALVNAEKSKNVSTRELNLTTSGTRAETIAMYEASVLAAQARVQQIQAQINKTILYAPFNGMITKVNAKKGEVISLMTAKEILISMIGEGYEIELNVPEIDVAKINIGDPVVITFDAFSDEQFESEVTFIEPAETVVQGVTYYQVKVALNPKDIDLAIRSGMSVDVDIITDKKEDVIKVPQRRVIREGGQKIVRILEQHGENEDVVEVGVETGIRDNEGNIEILSGLKIGDKLLLE